MGNIDSSELVINYRVYFSQTGDINKDFVFFYSCENSFIGDLQFNSMGYLFYVIASAEVNGVTFTGQRSRTSCLGLCHQQSVC